MKFIGGAMSTIGLISLLFGLSWSCHSAEKTAADLPTNLSSTSQVITIASGEYPPWSGKELKGGGFINEIVREAFALQGYKVQFRFLPWKRAYAEVKAGRIPASSYWYYKKERNRFFIQSDPIYKESVFFIYNKASPLVRWNKLDDLKGMVIGATDGFTYTKTFWDKVKDKTLTVQLTTSDLLNLRKLLSRRVELVPLEPHVAEYLIRKNFSKNDLNAIGYNPKPLTVESDRLLFSRKYLNVKKLVIAFNRGLAKLKKQGRIQKLEQDLSNGVFDLGVRN
jgi:polar amino acid transport system substrate-binding protein